MNSPQHVTTKAPKRPSLRGRLVRSHLAIAGIGLVGLALMLVLVVWARGHTLRLADLRGPAVRDSTLALAGVQRSLASLRGWMVLGDQSYRTDRKSAWRDEIDPAIANLRMLSARWDNDENKVRLTFVLTLREELKEAQWWIEEVAHTPGNEPARVIFAQELAPVHETIVATTNALIDIEKEQSESGRRPLFAAMADLARSHAQARASVVEFVDEGDKVRLDDFRTQREETSRQLGVFDRSRALLTAEQRRLFEITEAELPTFYAMLDRIIEARQSAQWNVAQHRLAEEAVPRARAVIDLLRAMTADQDRLISIDARLVTATRNIAAVVSVVLMLVFGIAAWFTSVSPARRLAKATQRHTRLFKNRSW
jgi:methyl-accepting chemotaxis protein